VFDFARNAGSVLNWSHTYVGTQPKLDFHWLKLDWKSLFLDLPWMVKICGKAIIRFARSGSSSHS